VYMSDGGTPRRMTPNGDVSTLSIHYPPGEPPLSAFALVMASNGVIYASDAWQNTIRELRASGGDWIVRTIVGTSGVVGTNDGQNGSASFKTIGGLAI